MRKETSRGGKIAISGCCNNKALFNKDHAAYICTSCGYPCDTCHKGYAEAMNFIMENAR